MHDITSTTTPLDKSSTDDTSISYNSVHDITSTTTPLDESSTDDTSISYNSVHDITSTTTPLDESSTDDTSISYNSVHDITSTTTPLDESSTDDTSTSMPDIDISSHLPQGWVYQSSENGIKLFKILQLKDQQAIVTHSVIINNDRSWLAFVRDVSLKPYLTWQLPLTVTSDTILELVQQVTHFSLCPGNPDHHFVDMLEKKKGKIVSKVGQTVATLDHQGVVINNKFLEVTVRTSACTKVTIHENVCIKCKV